MARNQFGDSLSHKSTGRPAQQSVARSTAFICGGIPTAIPLLFLCFASFFVQSVAAKETLHVSFDGHLKGIAGHRVIEPIGYEGSTNLPVGRFGQSFVSLPSNGSLKFPTANIVNPIQGTVSMWVKPVDWSSGDPAFHVFFQILGTESLMLYKYHDSNQLLMLSSRDMTGGPYFSSGANSKWLPGEWHHIAGTWSSNGLLLYVDGAPVASSPAFALLPESIGPYFVIGDLPWGISRTSYSEIDEVRIYDSELSSRDIKSLYLGETLNEQPAPADDMLSTVVVRPAVLSSAGLKTNKAVRGSTPIRSALSTTLRRNGSFIAIGDRLLAFADGALPTQLNVGAISMLASPIVMVIDRPGERVVMTSVADGIWQTNDGDEIVVTSRLTASSITLDLTATVERDGLITVELQSQDAELPSDAELVLEIPLNADELKYRIRWQDGQRDLVETIANTKAIDRSTFVPYYWVGGNEAGLFWFSDRARNWPGSREDDAIRVDRVDGTLLFRQKLKSSGQVLPSAWKYRLGLQLTPVKSVSGAERRNIRIAPAENANIEIIWPTATGDSLKYYGYPEAANQKRFAHRIDGIKSAGRTALAYMTPAFVSTRAPEWATHQTLWMNGVFDSTSSDVRAMGGSLAGVDPESLSWQSFITDKAVRFQKTYGLDGFYFDNVQVYGRVPVVGADEPPSEHKMTRKDYPIFEYRELYKNLIEKIKQSRPSSQIIVHPYGRLVPPVISLAGAYVDGEQYRGIVKDNYLDVLGLDQLRATLMGSQWGLAPVFLPQFDAVNASRVPPTRGLMGLLMLHDVAVWPLWCNVSEVNRALSALDRFEYVKADFQPYFSKSPPASSSSQDVLVSSYRNTAKGELIVAVNISNASRRSDICLRQPGTYLFTNWMTGRAIENTAPNCAQVVVGTQDYALVHAASVLR